MAAPQPRLTLATTSSAPSAAAAAPVLPLKASSLPIAAEALPNVALDAPRATSFPAAGFSTLTTSSCTPETEEVGHLFEVNRYRLLKGFVGVGKFVKSGTFDVGGHSWRVLFYPAGSHLASDGQPHCSVYLQLMTPNVEVPAFFDLRLKNQSTGRWHSLFNGGVDSPMRQALFNTFPTKRPLHHPPQCWGVPSWKPTDLETPAYMQDGGFTIRCDIRVMKPARVPETKQLVQIEAPPPGLSKDFRKLLEEKDGKDVTVRVGGEAFPAHRTVLAARSLVLRKKLLDATDEAKPPSSVEITMDGDMDPAVFKAMLHFIYTDELPPDAEVRDDGGDETAEFVRRLLVAAEGCGMETLKALCESLLCRNLSKRTLKATMEFAGRHGCNRLRAACVAVLGNHKRGPEACKHLKKNLKRDPENKDTGDSEACKPLKKDLKRGPEDAGAGDSEACKRLKEN